MKTWRGSGGPEGSEEKEEDQESGRRRRSEGIVEIRSKDGWKLVWEGGPP